MNHSPSEVLWMRYVPVCAKKSDRNIHAPHFFSFLVVHLTSPVLVGKCMPITFRVTERDGASCSKASSPLTV